MSTVAIVVIVVAAVIVLAALLVVVRVRQRHQLEARRQEAGALRETAQSHSVRAEREGAAADQQAARARKAQAEADEQAALARTESLNAEQRAEAAVRERDRAQQHMERAQAVDPDADEVSTDGAEDVSTDNGFAPNGVPASPRRDPVDGGRAPASALSLKRLYSVRLSRGSSRSTTEGGVPSSSDARRRSTP